MRYFMVTTGIIITIALLIAIVTESVRADELVTATTDGAERANHTPLICLALVGGTALLAGVVWIGTLRRMPP